MNSKVTYKLKKSIQKVVIQNNSSWPEYLKKIRERGRLTLCPALHGMNERLRKASFLVLDEDNQLRFTTKALRLLILLSRRNCFLWHFYMVFHIVLLAKDKR